MKYLQTFKNLDEFNTYFPEGLVPSGILVYVKEEEKVIFSTNNIDGEFKKYEATIGDGGASQDEIDELLGQIEALQNDKEALETAKAELEAVVSAKDGEISTLEADKADLEAQVEELSANQEKHEFTFDDETKTLYINTKAEPIELVSLNDGYYDFEDVKPVYWKVSDYPDGITLVCGSYNLNYGVFEYGASCSITCKPNGEVYGNFEEDRVAQGEYWGMEKAVEAMERYYHFNIVNINGEDYYKAYSEGDPTIDSSFGADGNNKYDVLGVHIHPKSSTYPPIYVEKNK